MTTRYTLEQAQAMLPEARRRLADATALLADLRRMTEELQAGRATAATAEDAAALEQGLEAAFAWFEDRGIQVKGLAPGLLDFPARAVRNGEEVDVLLCWRGDEHTIAYYHPPASGYRGREPVAMLDQV